jgi:tetratricopeptide (TPR) repeat protein
MYKYLFIIVVLNVSCAFAQVQDTTLLHLQQAVKASKTDSLYVHNLLELGRYQLRRDFNRVTHYLNDASKRIERSNNSYDSRLQRAKIKQQFGIIYRKRADYTKSLQYYYEALPIFEEMQDSIGLASSYHNIATVLVYQGELDKSKVNFKKAVTINMRLERLNSVANNYSMLARTYKREHEKDSVLYFYDAAQKAYETIKNEEGIHQIMGNRALNLSRNEKYEEALVLQLKNLTYVNKIQKKTAIATSHYNLANIYRRLKQYDKALYHINKAITIAETEKLGRRLGVSYKRRSLIYRDTKQYYNALEDYRRYSKLFDSIFNLNKAKEIREIELSYTFEKEKALDSLQFAQEKHILVLQNDKESFRKKLYLSLIILASLIGFLSVNYFKKRWKMSKALGKELSEELSITKTESKQRLTVLNTEITTLNTEISSRKEEITELVTESLQHLKTKEKLVDNLKRVASKEDHISLKSIIADLNSDAIEDSRLSLIKTHLEELNFEFFKKIKEKHPNLTKTDIEICSYLRLSLGRKEIAALRFTSPEAVKKSRNRLRKKMNLSLDDDLEVYIKSI